MAFGLAGLILLVTIAWCGVLMMANSMSDAPSMAGLDVVPWFIGGSVISGLIAASHWLPHWNW